MRISSRMKSSCTTFSRVYISVSSLRTASRGSPSASSSTSVCNFAVSASCFSTWHRVSGWGTGAGQMKFTRASSSKSSTRASSSAQISSPPPKSSTSSPAHSSKKWGLRRWIPGKSCTRKLQSSWRLCSRRHSSDLISVWEVSGQLAITDPTKISLANPWNFLVYDLEFSWMATNCEE